MKSDLREPALEVRDVVVRFGGITALNIEVMQIPRGEIVGIVGANGAGKTTLLDVVSGFTKPERGTVLLDGKVDLLRYPPWKRAKLGLSRSFQSAELFSAMTVGETIAFACQDRTGTPGPVGLALGGPWSRRKERRIRDKAEGLTDQMGLSPFYDKFVAELSTGTRRIVDLVAVVAQEPTILLLDEPGSGVAQSETAALGRLILSIRERLDCTIIIIEHDIPLLRELSDSMYALEVGRVIASGEPDVVLANPEVIASYLGSDPRAIARSGPRDSGGSQEKGRAQ